MDRGTTLAGKRVLLVEDDKLISTLAVDLMEDKGIVVLGPAATLSEALVFAQNEQLDAAVLDVNLGMETSFAAARVLSERSVPFFYTTAMVNRTHPEIGGAAFLAKPYGAVQFFDKLKAAIRG
jgi:DNA-binding response OmpR family regulator